VAVRAVPRAVAGVLVVSRAVPEPAEPFHC
jgi:hypothetical protein